MAAKVFCGSGFHFMRKGKDVLGALIQLTTKLTLLYAIFLIETFRGPIKMGK
jgi:hypothetical protein